MQAVNDFRISQIYEDDVKMTRFRLNDGWDYVWITWHNERGFISITSSFGVWSYIWSAMGKGTLLPEFFVQADKYYLSNKLYGPDCDYFNSSTAIEDLKKELLKDRKAGQIKEGKARLVWEEIESLENELEEQSPRDIVFMKMQEFEFLSDWMNEPWEHNLGMRAKGDFLALRDSIIPMIKDYFVKKYPELKEQR